MCFFCDWSEYNSVRTRCLIFSAIHFIPIEYCRIALRDHDLSHHSTLHLIFELISRVERGDKRELEWNNSQMESLLSNRKTLIIVVILRGVWVETNRSHLEWREKINVDQMGMSRKLSSHSTRLISHAAQNKHICYNEFSHLIPLFE